MSVPLHLMVMVDSNWGIGYKGDQMVYLSQDLKRFKEMTLDSTVILGRKTLATFPQGKPLPRRRNLILSHNASTMVEGAEVFSSVESLREALKPEEKNFIIGGSTVYNAFLPYCTRAYVTKVRTSFPVDCYFPDLEELPHWTLVSESEVFLDQGVEFTYCEYKQND